MKTTYLSTAYLAPIAWYTQLLSDQVVVERYCHYIKQTYRNRCMIATANGLLSLSIPIEKPATPKAFTKDIRIAAHGDWQHLHWNAIVSAYNSSPFFEYYEDDFRPFYEKKTTFLFDFNETLREMICRLIDLEPTIVYSEEYLPEVDNDFRELIHPKKNYLPFDSAFIPTPYYQVFQQKHGFQPNLSIIDLLFNMGPESLLVLFNSTKQFHHFT
ncbi:MAG: WbqC family protein [Dysgonamonadaceae bacterium]|jgi:hypothetical protein|nr:WbqC family protein [Dysgonamonadaceae bacterium]